MAQFSVTVPLVKIDVERRLVVGRAAREERDKSSEIMDYATAKPAFQKWSDSYSAQQVPGMEMSKGNLRVMHSRNVAGKLTDLGFNDDEKSIDIVCKVSDDNEWQKVLDGCYTGFSIGGGYAKKWQDNGLTRYTPDVREISLVDNPCMPSARIVELHKADGLVEHLELRGKAPAGFAAQWAGRPQSFAERWAARPVPPRSFAEQWADLNKAFDESKHKRDHGKFAAVAGAGAAAKPVTADNNTFAANKGKLGLGHKAGAYIASGMAGAAAGSAAAVAGKNAATAAVDKVRYGSARNKAAANLRANRTLRSQIVQRAAKARLDAVSGGDPRTMELANAARRKVAEEAANDGRDAAQGAADADRAFDQVRRARMKGGLASKIGNRAARFSRSGDVGEVLYGFGRPKGKMGLGLALGGAALGALGGLWAGHKSIQRSEDIAAGKNPARTGGSITGDVARVAGAGIGSSIGGLFAGARGMALHGAAGAGFAAYGLHSERKQAAAYAASKKAS